MLLSSIQIQGFKSFADKTILKFGKGITAVVGPNGSGKSNISDAVRWVLGEQSTKSLRGQSMEDVIFGGTETRRPHGYCEVTLNIDNSDRSLNFDNDNVSVTRRYYRSHESEYSINNVMVRLKDIHELFMDTGVGRDGYSMIGQGKIDNIISSKSGERRDIFEEAAGISKYRYRKIEAERKLVGAEDNLLRLHDIVDELEARVGPLAEQSKKAEKFLTLSESKKELEIGLWIYTLDNSKELIRSQESKIAAAQLSYQDIEEELSNFDHQSEENTSYFARLTSDIEGERLNISNFNEDIVKSEGNVTLKNNDILHNSETIKRLENEIVEHGRSDADAIEEISKNSIMTENKNKELDDIRHMLELSQQKLSALITDSESISRKIESNVKELNSLTAIIADKRVEMVTADTAVDEITNRSTDIGKQMEERISEINEFDSELAETEKFLNNLDEQVISGNNSLNGYRLRLESKLEKVKILKDQHENIRLDLETKTRKIQLLKELDNNMEGFAKSVKTIMKESEKGVIRGIHGTISSLITVEKRYTVAIETALANSIQNIVVETEDDAKRAINYLKTNNVGRATFLPIDTIKSRDFKENQYEEMTGFVGIAANLVNTKSIYKEIIKNLLGGTIVAEDLNTAAIIAKEYKYKIKIVTLDGQVINMGGSFTGGSLTKSSGILSRAADIKELESQNELLKKKIAECDENLKHAESSALEVKADIDALNAELTGLNEDKIRTVAEVKRINDLKLNSKLLLKRLEEENNAGKDKLIKLKETSALCAKEINEIEKNKTKIQTEVNNMTGGREDINTSRESLANEITSLKLKVIETEKDIEALNTAKNNFQNLIDGRASRLEEIKLQIENLNKKNVELTDIVEQEKIRINNIRNTIDESEKKIADYVYKRNQTEKAGIELRANEREKTANREQIGGELARLCERKDVMLKEYDDVIKQLFDEYQLTRSEAEKIGVRIEKPSETKKELSEIKSKIRNLGNVNVSAIEEYKEVSERYNFLHSQIEDVEKSRAELGKLINQLTHQMQEIFVEGFNKINQNFSRTFTEMFGGGSANLTLSEPDNVLESGIDINVKLPGKNVPSLDGLSGGEKALIALSIYFAIMRVNAPPFCFLDEVDTALDDINVERFAEYMRKPDFSTQFICVTHRRGTMEAADMLYGVTMQEKGITKLLELNVSELEKTLLNNKGA